MSRTVIPSTIASEEAMAIGRLDAHDQAALVRGGQLSAAELTEAAILRAQHLNRSLHAISYGAFDAARARSRAPLPQSDMSGVPCLLKDSLEYPGMPSRSGSRSTQDTLLDRCLPFAARLDECGVVQIGKSTMPEFGLLPSTEPLIWGPTLNPWATDRSCGGSSGGAAVAVASGIVPVAHASDGGGSIRIPASCCGVVGFKPSRGGNVRARGPNMIDDLLCGDGVLSRSVRDVAWFARRLRPSDSVIGPAARTHGPLRIRVFETNLLERVPDPLVATAIEATARLCASLGHDVERLRLPLHGPDVIDAFKVIWGYLACQIVDQCEATTGQAERLLEPWTLGLGQWSESLGARDIERVILGLSPLSDAMRGVFEECDLVLSPVVSSPPVPLGYLAPDRPFIDLMRDMFEYIAYTPLQNLAGLPAISLPLHVTETGLPIGSMLTGARNSDEVVLNLAAQLEQALPWRNRWPSPVL